MSHEVRTGEKHHWWPESLSALWTHADGKLNCIRPDGTEFRPNPANVAKIGDGHNLIFEGNWSASHEHSFGPADSHLPHLAANLERLGSQQAPTGGIGHKRFSENATLPQAEARLLAESLASLVVRSPSFRNRAKVTVEHYGFYSAEHPGGIPTRHHIIAANIGASFAPISKSIEQCGHKFILYSPDKEFQFGDGFLHNFAVGSNLTHSVRALVPLTPVVAVACVSPHGAYVRGLRAVRISADEAEAVNKATQAYSCDFLFFRNDRPVISPEFKRRQFLEYQYHQHSMIEEFSGYFSR